MQPSTQVTHIPDEGVIEPSVLFLVSVAAEAFILESDSDIESYLLCSSFLFYFTGNAHFERACFYLGVTGLVTAVPAIMTGFFHWIFKYAASTKGIYVFKMTMSLLLFVYTAVVVYIHYVRGVLLPEPVDILMLILYLVMVPLAVATGHTGGKIVFG